LADVAATGTFASDRLPTLADTSKFFQAGSIGWSPTRNGLGLQGLQLTTDSWRVDAGEALEVQSSFFDARPAGVGAPGFGARDARRAGHLERSERNDLTIDRTLAPRSQRGQIETDF